MPFEKVSCMFRGRKRREGGREGGRRIRSLCAAFLSYFPIDVLDKLLLLYYNHSPLFFLLSSLPPSLQPFGFFDASPVMDVPVASKRQVGERWREGGREGRRVGERLGCGMRNTPASLSHSLLPSLPPSNSDAPLHLEPSLALPARPAWPPSQEPEPPRRHARPAAAAAAKSTLDGVGCSSLPPSLPGEGRGGGVDDVNRRG